MIACMHCNTEAGMKPGCEKCDVEKAVKAERKNVIKKVKDFLRIYGDVTEVADEECYKNGKFVKCRPVCFTKDLIYYLNSIEKIL